MHLFTNIGIFACYGNPGSYISIACYGDILLYIIFFGVAIALGRGRPTDFIVSSNTTMSISNSLCMSSFPSFEPIPWMFQTIIRIVV